MNNKTISQIRLALSRKNKPGFSISRARMALQEYNPDQPRVPAGSEEGGQWTGSGSSVADSMAIEPDKSLNPPSPMTDKQKEYAQTLLDRRISSYRQELQNREEGLIAIENLELRNGGLKRIKKNLSDRFGVELDLPTDENELKILRMKVVNHAVNWIKNDGTLPFNNYGKARGSFVIDELKDSGNREYISGSLIELYAISFSRVFGEYRRK